MSSCQTLKKQTRIAEPEELALISNDPTELQCRQDLRHTFATRLQRIGVDSEVRQALLGHRMSGMTANYSHGGPEWDRKLRSAVEGLEKTYPLSYETKAAVGQTAEAIDLNGESAGIRTQDPRLKRAMLYQLSYRLSEEGICTSSHVIVTGGILPLTRPGSLRRASVTCEKTVEVTVNVASARDARP